MCLSCFISNLFCSILFASLLKLNCTTSPFGLSQQCVFIRPVDELYFNTKCKLVWLLLNVVQLSIFVADQLTNLTRLIENPCIIVKLYYLKYISCLSI